MSVANGPAADPRRFPFPPAIPVVALLLGWGAGRLWPIDVNWPVWFQWVGWALVIASIVLAASAVRTFRRHHTALNPLGHVTTVVASGPFRYTRNPMYLSLLAAPRGWHARVSVALGGDPLRPRVSCAPVRRHRAGGSVSRRAVWRTIPVVSPACEAMVVSLTSRRCPPAARWPSLPCRSTRWPTRPSPPARPAARVRARSFPLHP